MIGKVIEINGKEYKIGDGITFTRSIDSISDTGSVSMPYQKDLLKLDIFTPITIYAGEVEDTDYDKNDLVKVFDGYITNVRVSRSKASPNITIDFSDKIYWFNFNEPLISPQTIGSGGSFLSTEGATSILDFVNLLKTIYSSSGVQLPFDIDVKAESNLFVHLNGDKNIYNVLDNMKNKSVIYIIYIPWENKLLFKTPDYIQYLQKGVEEVYEFDTDSILNTLSVSSTTSLVNVVVYVGMGGRKGVAADWFSLMNGKALREMRYYALWTSNIEELEKMARNKLLEISRNNNISFNTVLNNKTLKLLPGTLISINDGDIFNGEVFIIKSISYNISKSDVSCSIDVYSSFVSAVPENFVVKDYNITDINSFREREDKLVQDLADIYDYE